MGIIAGEGHGRPLEIRNFECGSTGGSLLGEATGGYYRSVTLRVKIQVAYLFSTGKDPKLIASLFGEYIYTKRSPYTLVIAMYRLLLDM